MQCFWEYIGTARYPLRDERKVPQAITGDVKVRVIDWHQVHSQIQTCPCTNPLHMAVQGGEQSGRVYFLVALEDVSVLQLGCSGNTLVVIYLVGGHLLEVLWSRCDV